MHGGTVEGRYLPSRPKKPENPKKAAVRPEKPRNQRKKRPKAAKTAPLAPAAAAARQRREAELLSGLEGLPAGQLAVARGFASELAELEGRLAAVRGLPLIAFDPARPARQSRTDAGKLYKSLLDSYAALGGRLVRMHAAAGDGGGEGLLASYLDGGGGP